MPSGSPRDDEGREATRLSGQVLGLGLNVVVAAFFFGFIGRWVGQRIGGEAVLTLLGGALGAAAGFWNLYVHLVVRPREERENESS